MDINYHSINLIIAVAGTVLASLGLVQTLCISYLEKRTKHYFVAMFVLLLGYVLSNLLGQLTFIHVGFYWVLFTKIFLFFESLLSSMMTVLITQFLLHQSGEQDYHKSGLLRLSMGLWIVYVLMLMDTQFSGIFYAIDDQNVYTRGRYYPLLLVPPVLIMVVNLFALWQKRKKLSAKQHSAFIIYAAVPMISMLVQMCFYGIYTIVLGTTIAALFLFTYILNDQTEQYYSQQAENAQMKIDILLAQIQPHFLYNSLTTIRYLCRKDPAKAERAVTEFIAYLRHNMDSLSIDRPIPFEEELKHVKAYLALQKLRFGEELQVAYDLACTDFFIPTLTLQPLVENAVTYGVRRSEDGTGLVTVRTRRCDGQIEVSVIDDGPGFVYEALPGDAEHSHTGIKNVRERLLMTVGAELMIDSEIGKGTTVTIVLPQEP